MTRRSEYTFLVWRASEECSDNAIGHYLAILVVSSGIEPELPVPQTGVLSVELQDRRRWRTSLLRFWLCQKLRLFRPRSSSSYGVLGLVDGRFSLHSKRPTRPALPHIRSF